MKIAHLSDFHIDLNYKKDNYLRTKQLLKYVISNDFDHVIVSGDITESAEESSLQMARNLFAEYGLLDHNKLTLTIGNHDIYGGVHLAEDVINYPAKCKSTDYNQKVKLFSEYFSETFQGVTRISKNEPFPFIKIFDKIALIVIDSNSAYSMFKNPFASNGKISKNILKELEYRINNTEFEGKHKIVVTHHHFCKDVINESNSSAALWQAIERQTLKLRNRKRIIKQFKKMGVELVLHGHLHENSEYLRKGIKFINGGGSVLCQDKNLLNINAIKITGNEIFNEVIHLKANNHTQKPIQSVIAAKELAVLNRDIQNSICLN